MSDPIGRAAKLTVTIFLNPCDDEIRMFPGFQAVADSDIEWEGEILSPGWSVCRSGEKPKRFKPLDGMRTKGSE